MVRMKRELSRMTWTEARDVTSERVVAFLPIGSLEQNGPQNPLGTDMLLADFFARRVAASAEAAVILPSIPYGCSQAFQGFPGTIAVRAQTLTCLVTDVLQGAVAQGIQRALIVNNHGPNEAPIEAAVRSVRAEHGGLFGIIWPAEVLQQMARDSDLFSPNAGGHGGAVQTAAMLAISPDAVRMDLAVTDRPRNLGAFEIETSTRARFHGHRVNLCLDIQQVSESGVTGDPRAVRADQAMPLLERLVAWGLELVRAFQALQIE
jgi:creatinine amidohydrolase